MSPIFFLRRVRYLYNDLFYRIVGKKKAFKKAYEGGAGSWEGQLGGLRKKFLPCTMGSHQPEWRMLKTWHLVPRETEHLAWHKSLPQKKHKSALTLHSIWILKFYKSGSSFTHTYSKGQYQTPANTSFPAPTFSTLKRTGRGLLTPCLKRSH